MQLGKLIHAADYTLYCMQLGKLIHAVDYTLYCIYAAGQTDPCR
jgi:hypothetical protein